jgi:hypothetical protein
MICKQAALLSVTYWLSCALAASFAPTCHSKSKAGAKVFAAEKSKPYDRKYSACASPEASKVKKW